MKSYIKSVGALTAICALVAVLLALTNSITSPIIKANDEKEAQAALLVVMPEGKDFQPVDISAYTLPATVTEVYKESAGGCVVKLTTSGYGSGMVIMCGVNAQGEVTGATCLASSETLGYEKTYGEGAVGKNAQTVNELDTVAGATKTTSAYKNAVKDAIETASIINGEGK